MPMRPLDAATIHRIAGSHGPTEPALPNMARLTYYPIDGKCGLYLRVYRHGNDGDFTKLFRRVWRSIPTADRDTLVQHWEQHGMGAGPGILGVWVALENKARLRNSHAIGDCALRGLELKFY